jgi:AGCS family alanine or glycine:cation symporter
MSLVIGGIIAVMVALVLLGGIKRIGSVAEMLVPFMAVIYILAALIVIFAHINVIGQVFAMIFKGAFSAKAAIGGAFGITIMKTMQKGIGRGVFSNEAGLGSAPMAHAASSETNPVKQGFYGIFEVFMDTIVICSLTALALLCGICSGVDVDLGQQRRNGPHRRGVQHGVRQQDRLPHHRRGHHAVRAVNGPGLVAVRHPLL